MLLVASILLLIGGIIAVIASLAGVGLGAILGMSDAAEAPTLEGLFLTYFITTLVAAIVQVVASIYGIANHKKPEKAQTCFVFGLLLVAFAVLNIILSICISTFSWILILSLLLPLLYLGGAMANKPTHE